MSTSVPAPADHDVHSSRDKRASPRVYVDLPVRCEVSSGSSFSAVARDISVGGMFIRTDETPGFGARLEVTVQLPDSATPLVLPAVVRWQKPEGFGVQFGLLGARETHLITRLAKR